MMLFSLGFPLGTSRKPGNETVRGPGLAELATT